MNTPLHTGICSATTPFVLLGDVLDCLPLDQCDRIFSFVEENVGTWKSVSWLPFILEQWFSNLLILKDHHNSHIYERCGLWAAQEVDCDLLVDHP